MSRLNTTTKCPFPGCSQEMVSTNLLRDHLTLNHKQDLHKINTEQWNTIGLFACHNCNNQNIFKSKGILNRHILRQHNTHTTGKDNLTLLLHHLPTPNTSACKWINTLPWLHNLRLEPPPFRQNIWHKTNTSTKNKIKHVYHNILQTIVASRHPTTDRPQINHLHKRDSIWKIGILFQSLILCPLPRDSQEGTSYHINLRLHKLQTGDIVTLYKESRNITSLTPLQKKERADKTTNRQRINSAQMAANLDNYKSAIARLDQSTPVALNTEQNLHILKKLYPKRHTIIDQNNARVCHTNIKKIPDLDIETFIRTFSRIPQGKAAGPYADISDVTRALVTHFDHHNKCNPYANTVYEFFKIIIEGNIPTNIKRAYNSSFLFGLHKDPEDLSKLRPVAVGSGWRRAFTSTLVRHNNPAFTKYLMPYNYAVGVKGGTNFIYHTIRCEIEKYVRRTPAEIAHNPPTRCVVSLDISNMFNEISREKAMDIITKHFPHLKEYTNLLIGEPTQCWYLQPDGKWKFFNQEEGLPQGCPFSPVFAALVLHSIIKPLDDLLRERALKRKEQNILGDDTEGGITNLLAYVDDLNAVIPLCDALFFCNTFSRMAKNLGLRLNKDKSKILTSTTSTSPMKHFNKHIQNELTTCLKDFTNTKETTDGIVILGFPIGSNSFITSRLLKISNRVTSTFRLLTKNLADIQTVGQIFCNSLLPKFYYTLCADVFENGIQCTNIFKYKSKHCDDINNLFIKVLKFLTAENIIPPHVIELSTRPTSQNGIHLLNSCKSAITASCAPLLKSIQIANNGIPIKKESIKLPYSIRRIYKEWNKSPLVTFRTLKKHISQIMTIINKEYSNPVSSLQVQKFSLSTPAHLIHEKILHEYHDIQKDIIFTLMPNDSKHHTPSILTSEIPTTLIRPCRQVRENRLDNENFITSLRRSHRMSLFSHTLTCPCGQKIDKYGDHFFSCKSNNKIKLHNQVRDSIHFISSKLGTHANMIPNESACKLETAGLLPSFPSIRPGDVTLNTIQYKSNNSTDFIEPITAIDCTITDNMPNKMKSPSNLEEAELNRLKHHLNNEAKKYNRPPQRINNNMISGESIIQELNTRNITLKAFTVDLFGSIGPQAHSYFYEVHKHVTIEDPKRLGKFTKPGLHAYNKMKQGNNTTSLFTRANEGWKLMRKNRWFGTTYQTISPSAWGKQYLNSNINHAMYKHIKKGIGQLNNPNEVRTENKNYKILGRQALGQFNKTPTHRKNIRRKQVKPPEIRMTDGLNDQTTENVIRVYDDVATNSVTHLSSNSLCSSSISNITTSMTHLST